MEQRDIEIFLTLAEELHFGRTAARPDITYIPIRDGLPRERRLTWRTTAENSRIRAFNQTVRDFVAARANPFADPATRD